MCLLHGGQHSRRSTGASQPSRYSELAGHLSLVRQQAAAADLLSSAAAAAGGLARACRREPTLDRRSRAGRLQPWVRGAKRSLTTLTRGGWGIHGVVPAPWEQRLPDTKSRGHEMKCNPAAPSAARPRPGLLALQQ